MKLPVVVYQPINPLNLPRKGFIVAPVVLEPVVHALEPRTAEVVLKGKAERVA